MLLKDVHIGFPTPNGCSSVVYVSGGYEYYHYGLTGDSDLVSSLWTKFFESGHGGVRSK